MIDNDDQLLADCCTYFNTKRFAYSNTTPVILYHIVNLILNHSDRFSTQQEIATEFKTSRQYITRIKSKHIAFITHMVTKYAAEKQS